MRAILLADLYGSRRNLYIYVPLALAFMALAVSAAATVQSLLFVMCTCAGAGMLPVVSMGSAEASHWNRYAQMLPGGKAQAVSARFLEALAVAGAMWVYGSALFCAKAALGGWTWAEARFLASFVPAVCLLSSALCLGAVCRLGWAKGNIFFCVTICIASGSGVVSSLLGVSDAGLGDFAGSAAVLALPAAAGTLFGAVWLLSLRWYEQREL